MSNGGLIVAAATKPQQVRPLRTEAEAPVAKGEIPVFRIVCAQLALVIAVLALGRPWPVATGLGIAASVLLAVSAIRVRDRWLSSALAAKAGHLARRRSHDVGTPEREPEALLTLLLPETAISTAELGGEQAGILSRPAELVAVLRPRPGTEFPPDVTGGRLVLHAGPGRNRRPRTWLTLSARRDADVFDDEDLTAVLSNTVRRTMRGLARAGTPAELLSEEDIRTAVVALTHTGSGRGLLREDWLCWWAGSVAQAGFRLTGFDRHARGPLLDRLLATAPQVAITAAAWESGAVLRIAATTKTAVDAAATELTHVSERLGVRLERLDGRHLRAVAATLPIGGEPL